jgi:hypothetical protein
MAAAPQQLRPTPASTRLHRMTKFALKSLPHNTVGVNSVTNLPGIHAHLTHDFAPNAP